MDELTMEAEIGNITAMSAFIEERMNAHECPFKVVMNMDVAVDELLCNIAKYAYPGGKGEFTVKLEFTESPSSVSVIFSDHGIPYDPLQVPEPDITLAADERQEGGLGIFLVRKLMDKVEYRYENCTNILKITKNY